MTGKIPQGRDDLRQAWSWGGPQGSTWGAMKKGVMDHHPSALTWPESTFICKKSPNLLAVLLPLLNLSPKQCQRWVQPCAGKGRFPRAIRPKKECIKSCETCFANTLNLNEKGPSMKWVYFPQVLWSDPDSKALIVLWILSIWLSLHDNDWWAFHISPVFLCKLSQ